MNILLIIVVAFMILCAWFGMKRGFIKTVFAMFSFIVTLLLTALVSPVVSRSLQNNDKIVDYFADKIDALLPLEEVESRVDLDAKKTAQAEFLQKLPLPESIVESLTENNSTDYYEALGVHSFVDYLCRSIASMIINALAFAGTFLVVFILLKILCFSLDLVSKLPVLNQINHLFGFAAGFLYAIMIVWVGCILLMAFGTTEFGSNLMKMVSESRLLSFIYNHNLLLSKITDLTKILF